MDILGKVFSECGILNLGMAIVVIWLATQLQQERKGREADRRAAIETIDKYRQSNDTIVSAHAKLEELRIARGGGHDD